MDSILSSAIVGTGQASKHHLTTGTPIDTHVAQLTPSEIERKLLLAAGSLALYQQAGNTPAQAPEPPQPAASENAPTCSKKAMHLLQELFQKEQHELLLTEALQRLKQARQRLPYELLPVALGYGARSKEIRPLLFAVLGERGRWLSQFEKTWAWATQFLVEISESLPHDAETLWQEGTLGQRSQLLARMRAAEPAKAHEWLSDVWKQEKAEARAEFLSTFITGLSSDDEAFLEKALDDRSETVRDVSANLLVRIPTSALAQRMLARADVMLTHTHGKFSITLPTLDASWQRDGIAKPPNQNTGTQTWYTQQVLALIPPTHWEERFSIAPSALIATLTRAIYVKQDTVQGAASKSTLMEAEEENAWGKILLGCWSYAATLFESPHWIEPLWAWWCANPENYSVRNTLATDIYQIMGKRLPYSVAEKYALEHLEQTQNEQWTLLLEALPTPWSQDFGAACLEALRKHVFALDGKTYPTEKWQTVFTTVVHALPPSCFETALAAWEFPEHSTWQLQQWKNQVKTFTALIRKRQQIMGEI